MKRRLVFILIIIFPVIVLGLTAPLTPRVVHAAMLGANILLVYLGLAAIWLLQVYLRWWRLVLAVMVCGAYLSGMGSRLVRHLLQSEYLVTQPESLPLYLVLAIYLAASLLYWRYTTKALHEKES